MKYITIVIEYPDFGSIPDQAWIKKKAFDGVVSDVMIGDAIYNLKVLRREALEFDEDTEAQKENPDPKPSYSDIVDIL